MDITVLDNWDYLEQKKVGYLVEMQEKKLMSELEKFREMIEDIKQELKTLREEINYVRNSYSEETPITIKKADKDKTVIGDREELTEKSEEIKPKADAKTEKFKDGDISIEKFFYCGKK